MRWFKHDTNANMDDKLQEILLDYGLEGYGLYWYCIELISNRISKDNLTFELKHDARIIARNTGSTVQKVEQMMRSFIELGLFENSDGVVTCLKLAKRLDQSMTSNPEMREMIQNIKNHDSIMTQSGKVMQDKTRLDQTRLELEDKEGDNSPCNLKNKLPTCPHKEILKIWSEVMPEKRQPMTWDGERSKNLAQRWKEGFVVNPLNNKSMYETKDEGLEWWKNFLTWQRNSDFLMNQCKPYGIDWIVKKANFTKILESKYHN